MDPPSEADGFVSIICEPREVPAGVGLAPQPERRQRTVTDHDPADTRCGRHLDLPRRSPRRPSTGAGPRDRLARNAARRATARRSKVQAKGAGHPAAGGRRSSGAPATARAARSSGSRRPFPLGRARKRLCPGRGGDRHGGAAGRRCRRMRPGPGAVRGWVFPRNPEKA